MSGQLACAGPTPRAAAGRRPARLAAAVPAWVLTAVLGIAYLIAAPPSPDLATAAYRSDLFGRVGVTVWDNAWYAGHHLPAYSMLAPGLGWLLGPRLVAVASMTIATALFAALVADRFAEPASRLAALWFALGAAIALLSCRVAFDLGLALGLAALLAAQRGRRAFALALAVLCALASPVAGGFLALAAVCWLLALRAGWFAAALAGAALIPVGLLALAFPEGGTQPFVASAFYPALAGVLVIAALIPGPREGQTAGERVLRIGALVYAAALVFAYLLETPAGGNVDRLGALAAGPLAACALAGAAIRQRPAGRWRVLALGALAPALLYWQANAPVADVASAVSDPAANSSYYAPLFAELDRLGVGYRARPARIEVVPTADHWEANFVAAHIAIARGWERQLDRHDNALFYGFGGPLTAPRLRAWLAAGSISYIALPDAPLDYSAKAEARLLRANLPGYLAEVWRSRHWRLFAVRLPEPLAQPPAVMTHLDSGSFTVLAPRAGVFGVRVRFTPYWALAAGHGCVQRAAGGWTAVQAKQAASLHVILAFSITRVLEHGPRCR